MSYISQHSKILLWVLKSAKLSFSYKYHQHIFLLSGDRTKHCVGRTKLVHPRLSALRVQLYKVYCISWEPMVWQYRSRVSLHILSINCMMGSQTEDQSWQAHLPADEQTLCRHYLFSIDKAKFKMWWHSPVCSISGDVMWGWIAVQAGLVQAGLYLHPLSPSQCGAPFSQEGRGGLGGGQGAKLSDRSTYFNHLWSPSGPGIISGRYLRVEDTGWGRGGDEGLEGKGGKCLPKSRSRGLARSRRNHCQMMGAGRDGGSREQAGRQWKNACGCCRHLGTKGNIGLLFSSALGQSYPFLSLRFF